MWLPDGEKNLKMFIRFDRMYERDRHTDTQTDRQTHTPHDIGRVCIASRGKNGRTDRRKRDRNTGALRSAC